MFERFTKPARIAVIVAQEEARELQHRQIGSEHLLLALLAGDEADPARSTLEAHGLDHDSARTQLLRITGTGDLDADALRSIGIDLGEIRRRMESEFGAGALDDQPHPTKRGRWLKRGARVDTGHIPFTDEAKTALELSLREAIQLRDNYIGTAHLMLGILRGGTGLGLRILEAQSVDIEAVRTALRQRLRDSA